MTPKFLFAFAIVSVGFSAYACSDLTCEDQGACTATALNDAGSSGSSSSSGTLPDGAPVGPIPGECTDKTTEQNCGECGKSCTPGTGCFSGKCGGTVVGLTAGLTNTCAVTLGGRVYCWGDNSFFQTGDPGGINQPTARLIEKDADGAVFDHVVEVSIGKKHGCARKDDNSVWCWGTGDYGQVTTSNRPKRLASQFKTIKTGDSTTCGITSTNVVQCWGHNNHGALGHAPNTSGDSPTSDPSVFGYFNPNPVAVLLATTPLSAEKLSLAREHGCALTVTTHQVYCWGSNHVFPIAGVADGVDHPLPLEIAGAAGATEVIAFGAAHACAMINSVFRCWGGNTFGQFGIGTRDDKTTPTPFGNFPSHVLGGGTNESICALTDSLYCAGYTGQGAVGHGMLTGSGDFDEPNPVNVKGRNGAAKFGDVDIVTSSNGPHACVRATDNTVWCWGVNSHGQLGNGKSGQQEKEAAPVQVQGLP